MKKASGISRLIGANNATNALIELDAAKVEPGSRRQRRRV